MRHIPEEELHAYLDQALSRSQCVEIERHLAECPRCQSLRDGTAALRDRTTSLLALIGPPPIVPPPFAVLESRYRQERQQRSRRLASGVWAASVAAAVVMGWAINQPSLVAVASAPTRPATVAPASAGTATGTGTAAVPAKAPVTLASVSRGSMSTRQPRPRLVRVDDGAPKVAATAPGGFARAEEADPATVQFASAVTPSTIGPSPLDYPDVDAAPVALDPQLAGLWRTVVPDSGSTLRNSDVPLVPGLSVVRMRVQPGHGEGDVTAVDQVLESGEMIRTISGPASRVGPLVTDNSVPDETTTANGTRVTVTIRQGDKMVAVTGPSEALGSLLSRVSSKRRY